MYEAACFMHTNMCIYNPKRQKQKQTIACNGHPHSFLKNHNVWACKIQTCMHPYINVFIYIYICMFKYIYFSRMHAHTQTKHIHIGTHAHAQVQCIDMDTCITFTPTHAHKHTHKHLHLNIYMENRSGSIGDTSASIVPTMLRLACTCAYVPKKCSHKKSGINKNNVDFT